MRQYSGFGTAAETHERFLFLIEQGNTGLNVAFDLPTQCGYDSDDPMAEGEVGRVGMAVDTLADMRDLFADIDLSAVSTSMTINGPAPIILAMYLNAAVDQVVDELEGVAGQSVALPAIGRSAQSPNDRFRVSVIGISANA